MKEVLILLGSVVHELQKERASCCLFVGSEGKLFSDTLHEQFTRTEHKVEELDACLAQWQEIDALPTTSLKRLTDTRQKLQAHQQGHQAILQLSRLPAEIIRVYSHELIYPLVGVSIEMALFDKSNDTTRVSAYANFLRWKEHTGRERAIGILGFLTHAFSNPQYVDWLQFQISEQESLQATFINLAGDIQRRCLDSFIEDNAETEVQRLHAILEDHQHSAELQSMTAESWFHLLSQKIDLMRESEQCLINTLQREPAQPEPQQSQVLQATSPARVHSDESFIRNLPLFNGVPQTVIDQLLRHQQVHDYGKGALLFQEMQPAKHIYLILSGWVKLCKCSPDGEEYTLHMLSSGDILGESQILLNTPFGENAEIAEKARILSFPANLIVEQVMNCHQLAVNMLKDISRFSQNILRLFKNTRLQTTEQRVGWFLLKSVLDQGGIHQGTYQLPFKKSLIASFLDMRPETFSRTLKQLKSGGLKFEKHSFQLLEQDALCRFCDAHIARSCRLRNSSHCFKPECAARYAADQ